MCWIKQRYDSNGAVLRLAGSTNVTLASGYREYREISRGHGRINDAHQLTDAAIDRSCYLTTIWHVCLLPWRRRRWSAGSFFSPRAFSSCSRPPPISPTELVLCDKTTITVPGSHAWPLDNIRVKSYCLLLFLIKQYYSILIRKFCLNSWTDFYFKSRFWKIFTCLLCNWWLQSIYHGFGLS